MFSAKTMIFPAIIPLLCRNHLPADFEKPLLHFLAHFSALLPLLSATPRACRKSWLFSVTSRLSRIPRRPIVATL
jgi:hypothetical protein